MFLVVFCVWLQTVTEGTEQLRLFYKKKSETMNNHVSDFFQQGMRESNSHQRFWRPLSYHLTNPLQCLLLQLYIQMLQLSSDNAKVFLKAEMERFELSRRLPDLPHFECGPFSHLGTSPYVCNYRTDIYYTGIYQKGQLFLLTKIKVYNMIYRQWIWNE